MHSKGEEPVEPLRERLTRVRVVWGIAAAWLALDQSLKAWALAALQAGEREVIPGVLWFNLTRNPGGAFGLFPNGRPVLVGVSLLLVAAGLGLAFVLPAKPWSWGHVGLGLVAGGGLGNLADRLFRDGRVVDFIDFRFWPVFNLADTGIVVGTALVFVYLAVVWTRPEKAGPQ